MYFIAYTFKGQVNDIVFAGRVKFVSSTILKYFCPLFYAQIFCLSRPMKQQILGTWTGPKVSDLLA